MKNSLLLILFGMALLACQHQEKKSIEEWIPLFNGRDIDNWIPKISGYEAGNNYNNTFLVEDGILKVSYHQYDSFRGEFGHLFYKEEFSNYRLRVEYRFVGEQVPGGADWAKMNSGVMLHCQSPESMLLNQPFPVCLEAQFLSGTPEWVRPTGNLCTPGTHVYIADTLTRQHCMNSTSKTYMLNEWVKAELIVYGDSLIHHVIEGDTVFTYTRPSIGGDHLPENFALQPGTPLKKGYISLQSESHPVEFSKVEILKLPAKK